MKINTKQPFNKRLAAAEKLSLKIGKIEKLFGTEPKDFVSGISLALDMLKAGLQMGDEAAIFDAYILLKKAKSHVKAIMTGNPNN